MKYQTPLIDCTLVKRYKRFLADVEITGTKKIVTVHVPNSGSMKGVNDPGSPCRISLSDNPHRKLPHTLEMVQVKSGAWVGVNTAITNKLVEEAFHLKTFKDWKKFDQLTREVKINDKSRLDFLLTQDKLLRYIEVKNVSMAESPTALFPDAVTERGQKHLLELEKLLKKKHETEILFIVQREDCEVFKPCDDIDPEYGKLLRKVVKTGVKVSCWSCLMEPDGITIHRPLKVIL